MLFTRLLLCALLVGLCAGLANSAVQRLQVVPIIAAAEAIESKPLPAVAHAHEPDAANHSRDESTWQPQAGFERTFWTVVANILGATGYALLLIPALAWRDWQTGNKAATLRGGLVWGLAGWFCLFVWPALGLRPELPGEAAAAIHLRQAWWLLAVVCAAGGLALLTLAKRQWRWLGLPLLAMPLLVGAPHADGPAFAHHAVQLQQLKAQFVVATAIASAVHWLVLGAVAALAIRRWLRPVLVDRLSPQRSA
ncbi:MAG: CbtA family protein [Pseudomonadales bacterium]